MEELRSILLDLQIKLKSIVNRIPEVRNSEAASVSSSSPMAFSSSSPPDSKASPTELPGGEGPGRCIEQYHSPVLVAFHKWARILLSLFIDKVSPSSPPPDIVMLDSVGLMCRFYTRPFVLPTSPF